MRKSPITDALFPEVRGKILGATFVRPEKDWYLSELASFLHTRPSSLQREIETLTQAGILKEWKDGRRVYLKADPQSPVFRELKSLFDKTAGPVPVLQNTLKPLAERIKVAFLYGSMARSTESSESDVDLMVIGTVGLSDLTTPLRRAEVVLGRQVNPTIYSAEEFSRKLRGKDHFLSAVLKGQRHFIQGTERELEEAAGKR